MRHNEFCNSDSFARLAPPRISTTVSLGHRLSSPADATHSFAVWCERVETPVALAIPVTDVFVLTIADIESFACTLSRWALTGLVDLGLSMRFTNLERKWTMASVEPEVTGLSLVLLQI